jgi:hypothetical protein
MPAAFWPALAQAGVMHRAKVITYDRAADAWKLVERFI